MLDIPYDVKLWLGRLKKTKHNHSECLHLSIMLKQIQMTFRHRSYCWNELGKLLCLGAIHVTSCWYRWLWQRWPIFWVIFKRLSVATLPELSDRNFEITMSGFLHWNSGQKFWSEYLIGGLLSWNKLNWQTSSAQ